MIHNLQIAVGIASVSKVLIALEIGDFAPYHKSIHLFLTGEQ